MVKRLFLVIILSVIAFTLCACAGYSMRWPRVCIEMTRYRSDGIYIPLREGYQFAENAYDITETEAGYDIIIHVGETREKRDVGR